MQSEDRLKLVAQFDHQVTGVAATADGRIFVNFPRWTDDAPISVAEVLPGGELRPYPDEKWNSWRNARANASASVAFDTTFSSTPRCTIV